MQSINSLESPLMLPEGRATSSRNISDTILNPPNEARVPLRRCLAARLAASLLIDATYFTLVTFFSVKTLVIDEKSPDTSDSLLVTRVVTLCHESIYPFMGLFFDHPRPGKLQGAVAVKQGFFRFCEFFAEEVRSQFRARGLSRTYKATSRYETERFRTRAIHVTIN